MKDLIERLERATGPNRRLDRLIGEAVGARMLDSGDVIGLGYEPYTASLDSALTLVPEGWMWDVSSSGCAWIMRNDDSICDSQIVIGGVKSPAIALCIAALRAREAAK